MLDAVNLTASILYCERGSVLWSMSDSLPASAGRVTSA